MPPTLSGGVFVTLVRLADHFMRVEIIHHRVFTRIPQACVQKPLELFLGTKAIRFPRFACVTQEVHPAKPQLSRIPSSQRLPASSSQLQSPSPRRPHAV